MLSTHVHPPRPILTLSDRQKDQVMKTETQEDLRLMCPGVERYTPRSVV